MTTKWTGTTEERYARLDQAARRCDGNNRRCTHSAVETYRLNRDGEIVVKQSCSRHRQQFVNNPNYVVLSVNRMAGRPAGASHSHTNY